MFTKTYLKYSISSKSSETLAKHDIVAFYVRMVCIKQCFTEGPLRTTFQSPGFKRVSLNKTPEFLFWGLNICVDFDLKDLKKGQYDEIE